MTQRFPLPSLSFSSKDKVMLKSSDVAAVLSELAGKQEEYDEGWALALIAVAASLHLRIKTTRYIGVQP